MSFQGEAVNEMRKKTARKARTGGSQAQNTLRGTLNVFSRFGLFIKCLYVEKIVTQLSSKIPAAFFRLITQSDPELQAFFKSELSKFQSIYRRWRIINFGGYLPHLRKDGG